MMTSQQSVRRVAAITFLSVLALSALTAAQAGQSAAARHFLWRVEGRSGGVVYLAGSVHALSANAYPLHPAFEQAFVASGTLMEEVDLAQMNDIESAPAMLAKGLYQDGRTFESAVSKETAALVAARLKETGIPAELVSQMKPWTVMLLMSAAEIQKAGLDASFGLDQYFFNKATKAGKKVVGLETIASQLDRLDRMPDALQEQMLRSTLADMDSQRSNLTAVVDAWQRGDAPALERLLLSEFKPYPGAYTSLIVDRNRNWMPQIEACLNQQSPCLVVVGAAHLVGPDGLITMLQQKGYRLQQQ